MPMAMHARRGFVVWLGIRKEKPVIRRVTVRRGRVIRRSVRRPRVSIVVIAGIEKTKFYSWRVWVSTCLIRLR
jgi:hypothetical protein